MSDVPSADELALFQQLIREHVPHNLALGVHFVRASFEPAAVTLKLEWSDKLIGNPVTGVIHGGAVTTLLDAVSGAAVYTKLRAPLPIATLDLRVDFLGKPPTGREIFAMAECYRVTRSVAFVRAVAFVEDEANPFASSSSTFALSTKGSVPGVPS
ncbi:MAG: PaaI family thioesterase [Archangium sp.]